MPLLLCGSMLGVPLLPVLDAGEPEATEVAAIAERTVTRRASRSAAAPRPTVRLLDLVVANATTTTTTTAPPPPTTARPRPKPTTTTVRAAVVTKAAAPKPKPAPAPEPAATGNTQSGKASWYEAPGDHTCAHRSLPKGTIVTVKAVANGRTATCRVADRGPFVAGRVIDLDKPTFAALAPPGAGVIDVVLSW